MNKLDENRAIVCSVLIASFLAFMQVRRDVSELLGNFPTNLILLALSTAAIMSTLFLISYAQNLRSSPVLGLIRPFSKKEGNLFYDLAIDSFVIVPLLFSVSYAVSFIFKTFLPQEISNSDLYNLVTILLMTLVLFSFSILKKILIKIANLHSQSQQRLQKLDEAEFIKIRRITFLVIFAMLYLSLSGSFAPVGREDLPMWRLILSALALLVSLILIFLLNKDGDFKPTKKP